MSIFDLEPSNQLKPVLSKCTNHFQSDLEKPLFSGTLAVKTTSGRFKSKLIKIINKKMIFCSVFHFFF